MYIHINIGSYIYTHMYIILIHVPIIYIYILTNIDIYNIHTAFMTFLAACQELLPIWTVLTPGTISFQNGRQPNTLTTCQLQLWRTSQHQTWVPARCFCRMSQKPSGGINPFNASIQLRHLILKIEHPFTNSLKTWAQL